MYYTGTKQNFENRLHSAPTGIADLFSFQSEGQIYLFSGNKKNHVNREFQHTYYEIGGRSGFYMSGNWV